MDREGVVPVLDVTGNGSWVKVVVIFSLGKLFLPGSLFFLTTSSYLLIPNQ